MASVSHHNASCPSLQHDVPVDEFAEPLVVLVLSGGGWMGEVGVRQAARLRFSMHAEKYHIQFGG